MHIKKDPLNGDQLKDLSMQRDWPMAKDHKKYGFFFSAPFPSIIILHYLLSSDTGFQVLTPTEVAAAEEGKDPEQFGFDVGFCHAMKKVLLNIDIIFQDQNGR